MQTFFSDIAVVHVKELSYTDIAINGELGGVQHLHIGKGVTFLIEEKV